MSTTAETLRTAAGLIRERGLAIGQYEDGSGQLCLHGAIAKAANVDPLQVAHPGLDAAMIAVSKTLPDRCSECWQKGFVVYYNGHMANNDPVYHYNDYHCDGGEDAALVLEQAAEKLEANN